MRKTRHLQALSHGVAEPLPVSPLMGASNGHPSPLWRTWGQWDFKSTSLSTLEDLGPAGASSKKAQCLELIADIKMPQNRGLTLLEGPVEGIAPGGSVSSHWPLQSDEQISGYQLGFCCYRHWNKSGGVESTLHQEANKEKLGCSLRLTHKHTVGLWWVPKTWLHTWVSCSSSFCRRSTGEDRLEVGNLRNK